MPIDRLTEKRAANAPIKSKPYQLRDARLPGFFLQVSPGGSRSWKVQVDLRRPGERVETIRRTLGRVGELSLEEARLQASTLIAQVKAGRDPRPQREAAQGPAMWSVAQAYDEYIRGLKRRGKSDRTANDMRDRFARHMAPEWADLPIADVTGLMMRARHEFVTDNSGPRVANQCVVEFGSVWRLAQKTFGARVLLDNPTAAVDRNEQKPKKRSIPDVAAWWRKVDALSNPLRREMHRLGLLSGLRPGNLAAIRFDWIDLERRSIRFPAEVMKARRAFELPLSAPMVEIVRRAQALAIVFEPTTSWLFPTRDNHDVVTHTKVWRDRALGTECGHTLRHAYSNLAEEAGLALSDVRLLMAHKVEGIGDVYRHDEFQFARLLRLQEQVSEHILSRVGVVLEEAAE